MKRLMLSVVMLGLLVSGGWAASALAGTSPKGPGLGIAYPARITSQERERTPEEHYYFGGFWTRMDMLVESLRTWGVLIEELDLTDPDWRAGAIGQAAVWDAIHRNALDTEVPATLQDVHDKHIEILALTARAGDDVRRLALAQDIAAFDASDRKIREATDMVSDLDALLEDFGAGTTNAPGGPKPASTAQAEQGVDATSITIQLEPSPTAVP